MANVRCPMCSKLNPPEAEVCSYCGARLKPLRLGQSGQPGGEPAKSDEPDWLKQLRTDGPDSSPVEENAGNPAQPPNGNEDVPDWLARIRERAKTETGGEEEEPDWMKGLGGEPDAALPADQGLDDWLSRLPGGQAAEPGEPKPPAQAQPPDKSEIPGPALEPSDWLRGLGEETQGASTGEGTSAFDFGPAETGGGSSSEEEDWMSKLSGWQAGLGNEETAPADSQVEGEQTPAFTTGDDYDWLNTKSEKPASEPPVDEHVRPFPHGTGLTGFLESMDQQSSQPAAPEQPAPKEGAPEEGGVQWTPPEVEKSAEEPSNGFGLTGFLSSLEQPGGQPGDQPKQPGEMTEDAFPGWEQAASSEAAPAEGLPDWFSSEGPALDLPSDFTGTETTGAEPEQVTFPPAPSSGPLDLDGWLNSLGSEAPASPEAGQAAASGDAAEAGLPDWLQGPAAGPGSASAEPASFGDSSVELPAWLSGEEAAAPEAPSGQPEAEKTDLPGWLSGSEAQPSSGEPFIDQSESPEPPAEQEEPAEASGLPAWLSDDFAAGSSEPEAAPSAPEEASEPSTEAENLPDWFASFEQGDVEKTQPSRTGQLKPVEPGNPPAMPEKPVAEEQAASAEETAAMPAGDDVPDWLREFHGQASDQQEDNASALIGEEPSVPSGDQPFTVDLPEWLGEDSATQPAEAAEQPALEASGEQLAQADLPEWVKEMRPLESILPTEGGQAEVDQRVEKAGPLAGMRGVLPVEEMAGHYRKPPIYSVKLRVTEKQRTQATLLESILAQESQPLLIPPERSRASGVLLRVLLAVFLLAALAFPVIFDVGLLATPSPAMFPAENKMYDQINQSLQSGAPVLLAVEYEPALSGEMNLAAEAVVDQLMAKNARIVLVSTTPGGPAMGQQLLNMAASNHKGYVLADQAVNLGYLPGGTISLVDFAQQPSWAAPATLNARQAWSDTFLKNVNGLGGFSQVILLTDRAEVGRAWVEQVQPQMGKIPLLVVASAQAAPLMQPYFDSGQIAGMTSGLLGGAIYAQRAGQSTGRVLSYLSAYQIGVVLAFAIVLVGGLLSGIMTLFRRKDREEE